MATNSLVKAAVGRYAKNSSLAQQQNQPSIADTDPQLLAARAEAEASRRKHWWSRKAQAEIILSEKDRKILRSVKRRAYYLDRGFKCCCFNVGLDGVIGERLCNFSPTILMPAVKLIASIMHHHRIDSWHWRCHRRSICTGVDPKSF
jgi:hypothetical protein